MMDLNMLAETSPLFADKGLALMGAALGCGLVILGAAKGIGLLAKGTVESIARQPEAGGRIFTALLIAAAMIEGAAFFALIICMLAVLRT